MRTKRKPTLVAGKPGLDPTLPDVSLILGGKERKLCFDFNAICLATQSTGINLMRAMVSGFDAPSLRGLLWASLVRDEPELTLDQVGALIQARNIPIIQKALMTAWFASVDDGEPAEGKPAGEAKAQAPKA